MRVSLSSALIFRGMIKSYILLTTLYRSKEEGYFIASELLKMICSSHKGVEAIRKLPTHLKRLQGLVEELTRKASNEKRSDFGSWSLLELEFIYGSLHLPLCMYDIPINATLMQEYTGTGCERKCREKIKRGCSSSKSGSKWSSLGIDACKRGIMLVISCIYLPLKLHIQWYENLTVLVKFVDCFVFVRIFVCMISARLCSGSLQKML